MSSSRAVRVLLLCGLCAMTSCGTVRQIERTAAAWERTAEALRQDATSRSETTESLGDLIREATPYLIAILLALAWGARALFLRGVAKAAAGPNGSATSVPPSGGPSLPSL